MDFPDSNDLLRFAGERAGEQESFVVELCSVNSHTGNGAGTDRVAEMILDEVGGYFRSHERIAGTESGDHHVLGSGGKRKAVYLTGHLDTVFPPEHPFRDCTREGDWLRGPGTGDMKGGLAVLVYALKALDASGLLDRIDLAMILGADEEAGSPGSRSIYERERENAAACICAECAGENGEFVVSRNGKAGGRIDCAGVQDHVGRGEGNEKSSAVLALSRAVLELESLNGMFPGVTVNVGRIEGGLGPSTVPGEAHGLFDMRWRDEVHYGELLSEARRRVEGRVASGPGSELEILNHRPAMPRTEGTERLLAVLEASAGTLGTTISTEHRRGTSDANFFGSAGVPTLDGFGPLCLGDHTEDERILVPTLASRTALLAVFLMRLAGQAAG